MVKDNSKLIMWGIVGVILLFVLGPQLGLFSTVYTSNEPSNLEDYNLSFLSSNCLAPTNNFYSCGMDIEIMAVDSCINSLNLDLSRNDSCIQGYLNQTYNGVNIYSENWEHCAFLPPSDSLRRIQICSADDKKLITSSSLDILKGYINHYYLGVEQNQTCTYLATRACTKTDGTAGVETCRAANGVNVWDGSCITTPACIKMPDQVICGKCLIHSNGSDELSPSGCADKFWLIIGGVGLVIIFILWGLFKK